MQNSEEKIFVTINGQKLQVEFDFNALSYLEEKTGKSRFDFYAALLAKKLTTEEELRLIHAGLIRNHETITFEEIGRLKSFKGIIEKVFQGYMQIMSSPEAYNLVYRKQPKLNFLQKIRQYFNK
jgi:hypothetical protein